MNPLDARTARPMEGGASFPLSNRLWRVAWAVIWLVFARFTPPPLHGWRRLVLNAAGASVAPGAKVFVSGSKISAFGRYVAVVELRFSRPPAISTFPVS